MPRRRRPGFSERTAPTRPGELQHWRRGQGVVAATVAGAAGVLVLLGVLFGPMAVAETYGGVNAVGLIVMIVVGVARARRPDRS